MFKKVIDSIKNEFTESEEERWKREQSEKHISNQISILKNKKCPICCGETFDKGYVRVSGPYGGAISGISTYHSGYNKNYKNIAHICRTCGYVLLFADFNTEQIETLK